MPRPKFEPLGMKCTSFDCENDLHSFRPKGRNREKHGPCRGCGTDPIDWGAVRNISPSSREAKFGALRMELIRNHFFTVNIDGVAKRRAQKLGRAGLREAAHRRIKTSVGKEKIFRDGMQTPFEGNVLFYAQHATACCCRKCMDQWHGIPQGRDLTDEEVAYCVELIMKYVAMRLPDLSEHGLKELI